MTEVLVGPTYTMELEVSAAASAYVRDRTGSGVVPSSSGVAAAEDSKKVVPSCLFLKEEETGSDDLSGSSSSSIGAPGDSDDDDENDNEEVSSSKLLSLDSLEDSLPIKRGLSSHFSGKSKSFANLSEVNTVKDMEKTENPFNKRRRVLIANKLFRKTSSFYSSHNPKSMPLLTLHEDHHHHHRDDHDDDDDHPVAELSRQQQEEEEEEEEKNLTRVSGSRLKKKICFKSQSCFSLADLHEEEYQ